MKEKFESIEEILDFAIEKEREAAEFYLYWADRVTDRTIKQVLLRFAEEEKKHERKIEEVKRGGIALKPQGKIMDLKISDYLSELKPDENMGYQEALRLAMQREKEAFKLYNDLADSVEDENAKNLFLGLAREEATHKLRLETIYDEVVYSDN